MPEPVTDMVGAVGLEPTILAAEDFKSPAYANSATPPQMTVYQTRPLT